MGENKIKEVLTRGVENIYPSKESFDAALRSGKKLTVYNGIDPTGPTLHLGHSVVLLKLRELQNLGHKIILLIGDYTALIGDPTDKDKTRPVLSHEQILKNCEKYKEQASRILKFDGENPAELKFNGEWLGKLTFKETVRLAAYFTVQQMIERDMFQKRLKEGRPIYLHEFLYPLMQGYDSVAMDVDAEVGGNDQTFNMLAGRTLMKTMKNKEKFVLATKLLADPAGKKMGKTEGNMVSLDDDPNDIYGKIMSWPDERIVIGFELLTDAPLDSVDASSPRDEKMRLARAVVTLLASGEAAARAEEYFVKTFQKKEISGAIPEVRVRKGDELADVLQKNHLVSSKSDFRRLIEEGAITVDEKKIKNLRFEIKNSHTVRVGKHRFLKITVWD